MQKSTIHYTWEKLHLAVRTLAANPSSLKDRLASAYVDNLSVLDPDEVPDSIKAKFRVLHSKITQGGSISAIPEDEASKLAEDIVSMYDAITRTHELTFPSS